MEPKPKPDHYTTICISIYKVDLSLLDGKVAELRRRGGHKMSRSELIRIAVAKLNLDDVLPPKP